MGASIRRDHLRIVVSLKAVESDLELLEAEGESITEAQARTDFEPAGEIEGSQQIGPTVTPISAGLPVAPKTDVIGEAESEIEET